MRNFSSPFQQKFSAKSPLSQNKVDPDAPGTPGKPGYEPPVVREELDDEGKKIWDNLRKENDSLLKSGMTQKQIDAMRLNAMRLKKQKEKNKKGTK